jgi:hypothetical protein
VTPQKKFPASVRDRVRQYVLGKDGKTVTREQAARVLGLDEDQVMHAMSAMIRKGEPFQSVKRGKSWRSIVADQPAAEPEVKEQRQQSFAEAAGVRPEVVSESLTRTHRHDRLEADVLNRTSKGSLIFQTDDGVVWIARKIEE